jgi:hypothetical protein
MGRKAHFYCLPAACSPQATQLAPPILTESAAALDEANRFIAGEQADRRTLRPLRESPRLTAAPTRNLGSLRFATAAGELTLSRSASQQFYQT